MRNGGTSLVLLLICCVTTGCIEFRDEILHEQPPWESKRFEGFIQYTRTQTNIRQACSQRTVGIYQVTNNVGLSKLAHQVLKEDVKVLIDPKSPTYTTLAAEQDPLPQSLAEDDVMIALVRGLVREYETLGIAVRCNGNEAVLDTKVPNTWLWRTELRAFGPRLVRTLWDETYAGVNQSPFAGNAAGNDIVLMELLKAYFMEYYSGEYIDRYGIKYSKPQIDFSITNEVIVAVANILMDTLFDYALVGVRDRLKDPIVFDWTNNTMTYLNKTHTEPTLARYLRKTLLKADKEPKKLPGVLEEAVPTGEQEGLTKQEVCLVHYTAGLSGEASEGLAAVIVRSLGGANAGPVFVLGKFSIGDNQTVAKLIDAVVETFTKRSADALFSHFLHIVKYDANMKLDASQQNQNIDWEWLKKHLKISEILTCLDLPRWGGEVPPL